MTLPESLPEVARWCDCCTSPTMWPIAPAVCRAGPCSPQPRASFASPRPCSSFRPPRASSTPRSWGHLAPVFGVRVLRELGVARTEAARLFLFFHLRGLVSAAVRLGLIGPLQGQSLQHRLASEAETGCHPCQDLSLNDVAQTAPLIELWQANQDRLYSRLFKS